MKDILMARAMRKVALSFPFLFRHCYFYPKQHCKKTIYLTFDDGPDPIITSKILNVLREGNVHATFFVGGNALKYPTLCKEIISEGHVIGGHTMTHPYLPKLDALSFEKEVFDFNKALSDITGRKTSLFRPPYGFINPQQIYLVKKRGYRIVLWTVDSLDCFSSPTIPHKVQICVNKLDNDGIVLMHDTINNNIIYSKNLISAAYERGFSFKEIT